LFPIPKGIEMENKDPLPLSTPVYAQTPYLFVFNHCSKYTQLA
jgi:hypothetical protein